MSSIVTLLEQTKIWRGQDGRVYRVTELDDGHLDNLIRYLERNAARLLEHRRWWNEFHGTPVALDRTLELESVDALAWLRDQPLYRELVAERNRRGAVDGEVVESIGGFDAADRARIEDAVRHLAELHDDLADVADAVAVRPPSVANDRELTELGLLLERYRDAIRRLGEL